MNDRSSVWLVVGCSFFVAGVTGCESLERKLTRKATHPAPPPAPIINFQDYSRSLTPLDRYRKHYLMFDYWNDDLIEALRTTPLNPKRFKRASAEALTELETLKGLLAEDRAQRLAPLVEERARIDRQLQGGSFSDSQVNMLWPALESQTRRIDRDFFWRDVADHLKEQ